MALWLVIRGMHPSWQSGLVKADVGLWLRHVARCARLPTCCAWKKVMAAPPGALKSARSLPKRGACASVRSTCSWLCGHVGRGRGAAWSVLWCGNGNGNAKARTTCRMAAPAGQGQGEHDQHRSCTHGRGRTCCRAGGEPHGYAHMAPAKSVLPPGRPGSLMPMRACKADSERCRMEAAAPSNGVSSREAAEPVAAHAACLHPGMPLHGHGRTSSTRACCRVLTQRSVPPP